MRTIKKGATDQSVVIRIVDSGDGTPETGVEHDSSGIDLWYRREGATKTSITEAALSALNDAHSDGGIEHIGDGYYRLDLPDAAFASGANGVMIGGTVTGMVVVGTYVHLVDYDPQDTVRLGLTALPNAAAEAAGGLYTRGTGAGQINQPANGAIDANAARMSGTALTAKVGSNFNLFWDNDDADTVQYLDSYDTDVRSIAANAITSTAIANDAITAAKIANGAIDAATFAADVDAEILSYLVDDATRIDASALNTATGTTIPAIVVDTNELQTDWTNGGRLDLIVDAILDDTGTAGVVLANDAITSAKVADSAWQELIELAFTYDATATYASADAGSLVKQIADNAGGSALTEAGIATAVVQAMFAEDSGDSYAGAVAGSVVKEIADNAGGASLTVQDIVDGVWDEVCSGHTTNGTYGKAFSGATAVYLAAGIAGTINTLDALDTAQDTQHGTTHTRLGTPSDLGSGATVAANLVDIESQTDDIGAAGAGLTALATAAELAKVPKSDSNVTWNATAAAQIQSETNDALVANNLDHLVLSAVDTNFATTVHANSVIGHLADNGAGFDRTTDSLEALRDRGDSAWITATGFSTHSAADVWAAGTRTLTTIDEDSTTLDLDATIRAAVGMASANLDTQIGDLPTNAELATALGTADDATLAAIAALSIPSANTIADAVLGRSVATCEGTAAEWSLCTLILATLESSISGTTWTIKRTDGSTTHYTKTLTKTSGDDPIRGVS